MRALRAHRDGHDVTLSHETGVWTIDGEPVVVLDDHLSPSLEEERAAVVARILEIEGLPPDPDRQAEWRALNIRFSEIDKAEGC